MVESKYKFQKISISPSQAESLQCSVKSESGKNGLHDGKTFLNSLSTLIQEGL